MRNLLLILGVVALLIGLLWIGQGTGTSRLAAIELHDQPDPVGVLRSRAGGRRIGVDLARKALASRWANANGVAPSAFPLDILRLHRLDRRFNRRNVDEPVTNPATMQPGIQSQ